MHPGDLSEFTKTASGIDLGNFIMKQRGIESHGPTMVMTNKKSGKTSRHTIPNSSYAKGYKAAKSRKGRAGMYVMKETGRSTLKGAGIGALTGAIGGIVAGKLKIKGKSVSKTLGGLLGGNVGLGIGGYTGRMAGESRSLKEVKKWKR